MAKIGNESKLILTLAEERMKQRVTAYSHRTSDGVDFQSYRAAVEAYNGVLAQIVREIEAR